MFSVFFLLQFVVEGSEVLVHIVFSYLDNYCWVRELYISSKLLSIFWW